MKINNEFCERYSLPVIHILLHSYGKSNRNLTKLQLNFTIKSEKKDSICALFNYFFPAVSEDGWTFPRTKLIWQQKYLILHFHPE